MKCLVVVQSLSPTLSDPRDCGTPGFPVLHHLPVLSPPKVISRGASELVSNEPGSDSQLLSLSATLYL